MLTFLRIFATIFVAEMGDKTQLLMIAITSRYRLRDIILGSLSSILVLNAMAVLLGTVISSLIPQYIVKIMATAAFLYFAWSALFKKDDDENDTDKTRGKLKNPVFVIFWTFFIAELGDKTQLSALTFAADISPTAAFLVFAACSLGLFTADVIGIYVGDLIKKHAGLHFMDRLAFLLFFIFGIATAWDALTLLELPGTTLPIVACALITIMFLFLCFYSWHTRKKQD